MNNTITVQNNRLSQAEYPALTRCTYQDTLAVNAGASGVYRTPWGRSAFRLLHEWLSGLSGPPVRR